MAIASLQDGEMRGTGPVDPQGRHQPKRDIPKYVWNDHCTILKCTYEFRDMR